MKRRRAQRRVLLACAAGLVGSALVGTSVLPPMSSASAIGTAEVKDRSVAAEGTADSGEPMTLWYDEPATDWESQSLPIGNGPLGASIFGGVDEERLLFNEVSLWTGGPGTPRYNYGNWTEPRPGALEGLRERIWDEGAISPDEVLDAMGLPREDPRHLLFGAYQRFGDVHLDFPDSDSVREYRRDLDIGHGVAGVSYASEDVTYQREYFATAADGVIVGRITADQPGSVDLTARVSTPENRTRTSTALDGRITTAGELDSNGMLHESQLQVINHGGSRVDGDDGSVAVEGADSVVLILAAGTDYAQDYPTYRGEDPHDRLTNVVDKAQDKGYQALRAAHVEDYKELFDRVSLDLGGHLPDVPTDDLLDLYRGGSTASERALEELFFQYGRYLLISSSRPGSLPANLQGVWNAHDAPPWQSDYHLNINLQMNYWLAESTNLSELTEPLSSYVDGLREPGRVTARQMYDVPEGWVAHHASNIFGWTGTWDHPAFFFPESGAWLANQLYDHYRFTGDARYLRETAYPVMKETAQFWLHNLRVDPRDGKLVAIPSRSPEIGPSTAGASMSQQILWHLFSDVREAAQSIGDYAFAAKAADVLEDLDPGLRIGSWGQLQEWKDDIDDPNENHRHVSHMFGLHPGRTISPRTTPELAEAAKVSLRARGDDGTGWSKAWKINFWARLLDGDHAHKLLVDQLRDSTLPNLWDTHPPFQIDGNFGATSGVTEMLLQSHLDAIDVLPALPSKWDSGKVDGLRARGAFTVGATWTSGTPTEIRLTSDKGGSAKLRSDMFNGKVRVYRGNGKPADHSIVEDVMTLPTVAGESYRIVAQAKVQVELPSETQAPGDEVPISVALTAADKHTLPATRTSIQPPAGWSVDPEVVRNMPLEPGEKTTANFTLRIPEEAIDGNYEVTAVVSSDDWTVRAPMSIEVVRHNYALDKQVAQSSLNAGGVPERAVDGDTSGVWRNGSVTHTAEEAQPWWQVDLGTVEPIEEIAIWNRTDCCAERLTDYHVLVSDEPFQSESLDEALSQPGVWSQHFEGTAGTPTRVDVGRTGRYIRVQLAGHDPLSLAEVQIF